MTPPISWGVRLGDGEVAPVRERPRERNLPHPRQRPLEQAEVRSGLRNLDADRDDALPVPGLWVAAKKRWGLSVDEAEHTAPFCYAVNCPDVTLSYEPAA